MKFIYVMIGLPGSGKSTKVQELINTLPENSEYVIHSTDEYFMVNGHYQFDPMKLHRYHNENYEAFVKSVEKGIQYIFIDNTNCVKSHGDRYRVFAKENGYIIKDTVVGSFDKESCVVYADRNTHGVPLEAIQRMANQYKSSY